MELGKRLVEVEEVIKYLVEDERRKIPEEIFIFIAKNKDKEYKWEIDKTKKLKDQELPDDTFAILAYISAKYLFTEEQKELMNQFYELNDRKQF